MRDYHQLKLHSGFVGMGYRTMHTVYLEMVSDEITKAPTLMITKSKKKFDNSSSTMTLLPNP